MGGLVDRTLVFPQGRQRWVDRSLRSFRGFSLWNSQTKVVFARFGRKPPEGKKPESGAHPAVAGSLLGYLRV